MTSVRTFDATADDAGRRLDQVLARHLADHSRSLLQRLIDEGRVRLNGQLPGKRRVLLQEGDRIAVELPPDEPPALLPATFDLPILHADEDLLAIDKPAGLTVHPGAGTRGTTLVNALLGYDYAQFAAMTDEQQRPGIVHRLDKDTSGILIVARNARARTRLARQFADRRIRKDYLALVRGIPASSGGRLELPIGRHPVQRHRMAVVDRGGRPAITRWRRLAIGNGAALLQVRIETGRTHQIRVHLAHLGYPVLGDAVYGGRRAGEEAPRQMLHAWHLVFAHPRTGLPIDLLAPPPDDLRQACARRGIAMPDCPEAFDD